MSTRASFEGLPLEIITGILGHLRHSKKILADVSLVSKKLHSLASPLLYDTIVLNIGGFCQSVARRYTSLFVNGHQSFHFIRNFGFKGKAGEFDTGKSQTFEAFNWIALGLLRHLENGQLRNFIWFTDFALTEIILSELKDRQKFLQGHLHFTGIANFRDLWYLLQNHTTIPKNLQSLTISISDSQILQNVLALIQRPKSEEFTTVTERSLLWNTPKLPNLKYLSLKGIGPDFLETPKIHTRIDQILDVNKLLTLKLIDTAGISTTLNELQKLPVRLKAFHLRTKSHEKAIEGFLTSFTGLEELYLDLMDFQLENLQNNLGLENHNSTLLKLFMQIKCEDNEKDASGFFSDFLEGRNTFPELLELAIPCQPKDLLNLGIRYECLLPKLGLLWLLIDVEDWGDKDIEQDALTTALRPLYRFDTDGTKVPFVAIGNRSRNQWPLVFELCEAPSVSGYIGTSLNYVSHRNLFKHNPDLTMLNIEMDWLPWQETRDFVDSVCESDFYNLWIYDESLFDYL
ncbi:hypothetical protein TWF192_000933 [Orbilia oligospora]|uniref:Uncharacterized protein n=1 Tax=Orbilia oligospora TaxID=2813651 RepID=A0A6G1MIQ9_ORBOL|nr:hypothetical protein TWF191_005560 [Orbilia oligospora]KAF3257643.1 hypothetical protein TWF192_000933 [Orbilia oligospora]